MKRTSLVLTLLAVLALVAAACGGDSGGGGGGGEGAQGRDAEVDASLCPVDTLEAASADGPVQIEFWHAMTASNEETLNTMIDDYNASQDAVEVTGVFSGSYDETLDKYLTGLRSGELPAAGAARGDHAADHDRQREHGARRGLCRGVGLRHLRHPPVGPGRVRGRGHALADAVQRVEPGLLLRPQRLHGGRPRPRRPAGHPRRDVRHGPDHRRGRGGRARHVPRSPALVPRAVDVDGGGDAGRQRQRSRCPGGGGHGRQRHDDRHLHLDPGDGGQRPDLQRRAQPFRRRPLLRPRQR